MKMQNQLKNKVDTLWNRCMDNFDILGEDDAVLQSQTQFTDRMFLFMKDFHKLLGELVGDLQAIHDQEFRRQNK